MPVCVCWGGGQFGAEGCGRTGAQNVADVIVTVLKGQDVCDELVPGRKEGVHSCEGFNKVEKSAPVLDTVVWRHKGGPPSTVPRSAGAQGLGLPQQQGLVGECQN